MSPPRDRRHHKLLSMDEDYVPSHQYVSLMRRGNAWQFYTSAMQPKERCGAIHIVIEDRGAKSMPTSVLSHQRGKRWSSPMEMGHPQDRDAVGKREKGLTGGMALPTGRGLDAGQQLGPYTETVLHKEIKHDGTF